MPRRPFAGLPHADSGSDDPRCVQGLSRPRQRFPADADQVISIEPGESDQALHRDQNAFDFYPFPDDYHVQCNTLWAMTDYTAEMGATRVVPGSQVGDKKPTDDADDECVQAEMSRGSVLLYSGKIVHSGAANRSEKIRRAINVNTSRTRCARSAVTRWPTASTRPSSTAMRVPHSPTSSPIASDRSPEQNMPSRG